MTIKAIAAKALKGRTFAHDLRPLTIVAGPNDTGKTAIADAITLALLGHLPNHPKTNVGIMGLASGSRMHVEAILEGRMPIRREWTRKGQTVKATEEGVDDLPQTPLVLLDSSAYFGATPQKQVEMIVSLCRIDATAIDTAALVKSVNTTLAPAGCMIPAHGPTAPVQDWLDHCLEHLATELQTANADVKRMTQTGQGLAALGANDTTVDPAAVEAELKQARQRVEALIKAHAELGQKQRGLEASQAQARTLRQRIADAIATIGDEPTRDIETVQADLEAARQNVFAAESARRGARAHATQRRILSEAIAGHEADARREPELKQEVERLSARTASLPPDIGPITEQVTQARQRVADIKASQAAADEALAQARTRVQKLTDARCCPTCGAKGADFTALLDEILTTAQAEHTHTCSRLAADYSTATIELTRAEAAQNEAQKASRAFEADKTALDVAKAALERSSKAAQEKARLMEELSQMGDTPVVPDDTEANTRLAALQAEQQRAAAKLELERAQRDLAAIPGIEEGADELLAVEIANTEQELDIAREAVAALDQRKRLAEAQIADARRAQQAQDERTKAEAAVTAIKAAQAAVKDAREALVATALEPLLRTANAFVQQILPTPLEFRDGELGRFGEQSWIPVRAFGGTHTAVACAGLQAALGAQAPARIVIVDELGRFDATNKIRFLRNVRAALAAGTIEQFIGMDVDARPYTGTDAITAQDLDLHLVQTAP